MDRSVLEKIHDQIKTPYKFGALMKVIKENGNVYHYYCAVNDADERFIALATSQSV